MTRAVSTSVAPAMWKLSASHRYTLRPEGSGHDEQKQNDSDTISRAQEVAWLTAPGLRDETTAMFAIGPRLTCGGGQQQLRGVEIQRSHSILAWGGELSDELACSEIPHLEECQGSTEQNYHGTNTQCGSMEIQRRYGSRPDRRKTAQLQLTPPELRQSEDDSLRLSATRNKKRTENNPKRDRRLRGQHIRNKRSRKRLP